ncbi:hypothetical protein ACI76O_01905 [Capnocytophaga cynodegmi]|uniref:hypothetical protein n=1 Tax=Capnocytophaga cynodegmi TaxID=28189 RepID=UPI00385DBE65
MVGILFLTACQEKEFLTPEVGETTIVKNRKVEDLHFPFADLEELNQFKNLNNVVHYEMARKIALLELQATGFVQEMNWNGYRLSEKPVLIYDLNSVPKYYDYIALDTENNPIGTVRVNATKEKSTILQGMFSKTFNYNELLSKSSVSNPSFFMDWKGTEFVGLKSKSGEAPTQIVSTETGETIPQSEVKELSNQEIIDFLTEGVFPTLLPKDEKAFENIPAHLAENDTIREEIEFSKNINIEALKDSMQLALRRTEKDAEAFWKAITEVESELVMATDEEINDANSKFFGRIFRWVRRVFNFKTNKDRHTLREYADNTKINDYGHINDWCGPWVCGYIVYAKQGKDKYQFFEDCASTFGELGILNNFLRYLKGIKAEARPMTPAEMSWSMPIASNGKIWINPIPNMAGFHAYQHISDRNNPVIRLCASGGELHYTLVYGVRQTGNYWWRNYYFLQIDNGSLYPVGNRNQDPERNENYHSVDWWNPWFLVWD